MATQALDISTITKSPIAIDPKLWDAFAQDREEEPYVPLVESGKQIIDCPGCKRPTRGRRATLEECPGTVTRSNNSGLCSTCWTKSPDLRVNRPKRPNARTMVTHCPGEGCGKKTRSKYTTAEEIPHAIIRVNNSGICLACYRKANAL